MADLVWKDIVAAGRPLLLVIPFGVLQLAVTASVGPVFLPAALFFAAVLAFGSIPIEESQRTEILWNSLPVARGSVVLARYATALVGMLMGLGVSWAVGRTINGLMGEVPRAAAFTSVYALALLFVVLALAAAVFLPFYFHSGLGRGLLRFSAVAVVMLLVVSVTVQVILAANGYSGSLLDPEMWEATGPGIAAWLAPRWRQLIGLLVVASCLAMAASSLVSRLLYERRDL